MKSLYFSFHYLNFQVTLFFFSQCLKKHSKSGKNEKLFITEGTKMLGVISNTFETQNSKH